VITEFSFDFWYGDKVTQEDLDVMRPHCFGAFPESPDKAKYHTFQGDITSILRARPNLSLSVNGGKEMAGQVYINIMERLTRIEAAMLSPRGREQQFNERVNVHVPGHFLMTVDDVRVEENCCTEFLQDRLREGWRILAICPQPDQRRPDYVLGRTQPRE
jgi:hypothetical protein